MRSGACNKVTQVDRLTVVVLRTRNNRWPAGRPGYRAPVVFAAGGQVVTWREVGFPHSIATDLTTHPPGSKSSARSFAPATPRRRPPSSRLRPPAASQGGSERICESTKQT
eukprot:349750-Chlamydomonas_euryale.AAC.2